MTKQREREIEMRDRGMQSIQKNQSILHTVLSWSKGEKNEAESLQVDLTRSPVLT